MLAFDDFPPHVRLLLLTADPTPGEQKSAHIRSLAALPAFPWAAFLALAEHHRLVPLVFQSLVQAAPPQLPPAIHDTLHRQSTRNAFAALQAVTELHHVTEAFVTAGFPLVALKGITLSQILYGTPNARHVGDLDLLTTPSRLDAQLDLLASLAYTRVRPEAPLTPRRTATFVRFWKDFTLAGDTFELDFHWRLFNNPHHAANRLLATPELTATEVFGTTFPTLSLRNQFLYTAAHASGESFTYLKTLADVAAFLRLLSPAQLDDALLRARDLGLLPQVSAAVHLAKLWMQTDITSTHLLPATHPLARRLHRRTATLLARQNFLPTRDFPSPLSWLRLELQLTPGLRSLAQAAARFAFRPRVWSAVSLPDRFFALYPLLGLLLPPRRHTPAEGQSHAAPLTPLESPNTAGTIGVSKSPPNT